MQVLLTSRTTLAWPGRAEDATRVAELPPGSVVALADRRPGARRRLRRAAGRLGVRVEAAYIVVPTWGRATFVAADDPAAVTWLLSTFSTAPPRVAHGRLLIEVAQRVWQRAATTRLGAAATGRLLGAVVPGMLVIGTRR
ncbi:hypothetical protein GCM10027053_26570 [Intrasporangium mesophilum]